MNSMLKILLAFVSIGIVGCASNQSKPDSKLNSTIDTFLIKPIFVDTSEVEGWGGDIRLSFTEKYYTDTSIIYNVNSTFENKHLQFKVSVPKEGHVKLVFKSLGAGSDNFVRFLKYLYSGVTDSLIKFNNQISVDCIHMGNYVDSLNMQSNGTYTTTHTCKLFFQGEKENDYAELYFNINDDEHWIELREKDKDYRNMIIKFLATK
ncbi:hypothetical protein GCM10027043_52710 [Ferruginibacter profundus]